MDYAVRRKLSFVILALIFGQFWYYPLVDGLSDTALASLGFSLAQIITVVIPFMGCLVWEKERLYNRATFVMSYFFVLGVCDYSHSLIYNLMWDICSVSDLTVSIFEIQYILIGVMAVVRVLLSIWLYKWSFGHIMIAINIIKNKPKSPSYNIKGDEYE